MNPLSIVVRTVCDLFAWFMIVFGVNVLVHGYMTPGGGFQGGAIMATFMAFLVVAYGGKRALEWAKTMVYDLFEEVGLLVFMLLALWGFPNSFFYNSLVKPFVGGAGMIVPECGTIALMSIAVGLEVVGALSLIILTMYRGIRMFGGDPLEMEIGHDR